MTSRCGNADRHSGHYVGEGNDAWWCVGTKPTVTGTGHRYYAGVVTDRRIVATPGEICGHSHRSQETAANCARRTHKRLTRHEPLGAAVLRAFTVEVRPDGYCETPVYVGVAV